MKKFVLVMLLLLTMSVPAMATDTKIELPPTLTQGDFRTFSRDFGMALSYVPMSPAAPLGDKLPGFDAGVEASYVKLDKGAQWYQKIDNFVKVRNTGELPNALIIPRVHIQVGLPIIPIDFGVSYSRVPSSDIKLVGYELKYAILEGGVAMPAVAVRAAYTKLSGVDELNLSTKSLDLSISKGIVIFTPYAGVGSVWISSTPNSQFNTTLVKEDIRKSKAFVGLKTKIFPFINLDLEGDFSNIAEYSARLNVNF